MVRVYSPSSLHSFSSGDHHHPNQQFGEPGFHEPILSPPPPQAAAYLDHYIHSPLPPPPPYRHSHHQFHQFGRPAFSLLPAHDSEAPHLFMNHSPPPPPPFYGHDHGYLQQFGSPPPPPPFLRHHHLPPPPPHGCGHGCPRQLGSPAFQEPMVFPPPAHESGAPFHGHPQHFGPPPPPPPPPPPSLGHQYPPFHSHGHGEGRSQQFGRSAIHKPLFPPESGGPQLLISRNYSPPPHGHQHPPPLSHGHSHGHHHSEEFGRPTFQEEVFSTPPDLEPAAPHMCMSGNHSPPPPPPLDYYNQLHSPSSSDPHSHGGAIHHPYEFGRPPAFETEAPHMSINHGNHSPPPPPPPPPPHSHHSHSSPFHGFEHHAAIFRAQPSSEEDAEHFTSGKGLHPSHRFSGPLEGMSNWHSSEEEHRPPHHRMGGGRLRGRSDTPHELAGVAHHGRHSPPHPRLPPPKHRGRPVATPSYPPRCAPLGPEAHLSNGWRPHLAVPVW